MWFPDELYLPGRTNESSAFLLLSWNELFDPYTPDTFQPRLLHTMSLVAELREIAQRAIKLPRWQNYIPTIQEELSTQVASEKSFLRTLSPFQFWTIQHLADKNKVKDPREVESFARSLDDLPSRYDHLAFEVLEAAVANLPKMKDETSKALGRVATIVLRAERTTAEYQSVASATNLSLAPQNITEILKNIISRTDRKYYCYFEVHGPRAELRSLAHQRGFHFLDIPKIADLKIQDFFKKRPEGTQVFCITATASSELIAARDALRMLRDVVDVFNLYSNSHVISVSDEVLIASGLKTAELTVIDLRGQTLRKLKPRNAARELTRQVIDSISKERMEGRILNALEHYELAHSSAATRVRFVNLWTALECLIGPPRSEDVSIITNLCDMILPIIVWRRIGRIIRYVVLSLKEHCAAAKIENLGVGFIHSNAKGYILQEEILLALARPEGDPYIKGLLNTVSTHPLLTNRIYTLWKIFSNAKTLKGELSQSEQRTRWHLNRMYRARNMIVHQGETPPLLGHLLDTLHYYFSITMSRLLHDLRLHQSWDIVDSFRYRKARLSYIEEHLERSPTELCVQDFFPELSHIKTLGGARIWSP